MIGKTVRELRRLWGPLDPIRDCDAPVSEDVRAASLNAILASPETGRPATPAPRRAPRAFVVVATACVLTVVATAAIIATDAFKRAPAPVYAATPVPLVYQPPDGAISTIDRLTEIADAAVRDPARPTRAPAEYLRTVSWQLHSQVDGRQTTSAVVPVEVESWRTRDNAGRVTQRYREPVFNSFHERAAWQEEGAPGADTNPRTTRYPAGQFPAVWPYRPPTNAAVLAQWLQRDHAVDAGAIWAVTALTDLLHERVLTPHERAALIRFFGQVPGVEYAGTTTDRAGRRGEAFALVSDGGGLPTTYVLILDPADGRFLAHEQMLTTTAGRLNVKPPAVIKYETYLTAEWVSEDY